MSARPNEPEASTFHTVLGKIQRMKESAFTKHILEPLLGAMGYERIDNTHGPGEEGIDLVCVKDDDWGVPSVTVVQVKRYKPSKRAADSRSYYELVRQLAAAGEKELPIGGGRRAHPSCVCFVTPYVIDIPTLKTRFDGESDLRRHSLTIVDGLQLVKMVKIHLPSVYRDLAGDAAVIHSTVLSTLDNRILMRALEATELRALHTFYADLGLAVHGPCFRLLSLSAGAVDTLALPVSASEWPGVRSALGAFRRALGFELQCEPSRSIERQLRLRDERARRVHQMRLAHERRVASVTQSIDDAMKAILDLRESDDLRQPMRVGYGEARHKLDTLYHKLLEFGHPPELASLLGYDSSHQQVRTAFAAIQSRLEAWFRSQGSLDDLRNIVVACGATAEREFRKLRDQSPWGAYQRDELQAALVRATKAASVDPSEISTIIADVVRDALSRPKLKKALRSFVAAIASRNTLPRDPGGHATEEPTVVLHLKLKELVATCGAERAAIEGAIAAYQTNSSSAQKLRELFGHLQRLTDAARALLRDPRLAAALDLPRAETSDTEATYRLSLPLAGVLQSGAHIAVYGEAGAGKTTSLQMYARRKILSSPDGELVLFVPTSRLPVGALPLEERVRVYLSSIGISITTQLWVHYLRAERVTLLLDGIDEAIVAIPTVLEEVEALATRYPRCQIVVSSRTSGTVVARVPFVGVTLLPFTNRQRSTFVRRWFRAERARADGILHHLEAHTDVAEIVRNPLLATILCVLAQHGVPLPRSETRLYEERMRLLLGQYDIYKGVQRLQTHSTELGRLAQGIAFSLHERRTRAMGLEDLYRIAQKVIGRELDPLACTIAVNELIDPCGILLPMGASGEYGLV
ncbi:MAG: hypothetical protein CHACPFDD_00406 [Phycisphaerae bacterium]|nr:hypothetical protein [Phycisphaerae bacterium]